MYVIQNVHCNVVSLKKWLIRVSETANNRHQWARIYKQYNHGFIYRRKYLFWVRNQETKWL